MPVGSQGPFAVGAVAVAPLSHATDFSVPGTGGWRVPPAGLKDAARFTWEREYLFQPRAFLQSQCYCREFDFF